MNTIKAIYRALIDAISRRRIKAVLYDGYVGAYAEFYRNEYSRDAAQR